MLISPFVCCSEFQEASVLCPLILIVFSRWGALAGDFEAGGGGLGCLPSSLPASLLSGRAVVLSGRGSQSVLPGPAASRGNSINANFGDPPQT